MYILNDQKSETTTLWDPIHIVASSCFEHKKGPVDAVESFWRHPAQLSRWDKLKSRWSWIKPLWHQRNFNGHHQHWKKHNISFLRSSRLPPSCQSFLCPFSQSQCCTQHQTMHCCVYHLHWTYTILCIAYTNNPSWWDCQSCDLPQLSRLSICPFPPSPLFRAP